MLSLLVAALLRMRVKAGFQAAHALLAAKQGTLHTWLAHARGNANARHL
jgi:hypothetical protein